MQLSMSDAEGGEGFRNIMCALGSCKGTKQPAQLVSLC